MNELIGQEVYSFDFNQNVTIVAMNKSYKKATIQSHPLMTGDKVEERTVSMRSIGLSDEQTHILLELIPIK